MRLEMTMNGVSEAAEIAAVLSARRITRIGINHLAAGTDPVVAAKALLAAAPGLDVMVHLSARHFAGRSVDEALAAFRRSFEEAERLGVRRVLVVSGHPRQTFDALDALQCIQGHGLAKAADIFCAYNPFFDPARQREENERLRRKLAYPFVKGIGFQIGMDIEKVRKAVEFIRSVREGVALFGEVPVPAADTIERLKVSQPYGVFLPNCYFASIETAKEMTDALLKTYAEFGIEPTYFSTKIEEIA